MNTEEIIKRVKNVISLESTKTKLQQTIVDSLVDKEIYTRSELLMSGFKKIEDMKKEIKKIKPDVVLLNEEGVKVNENYSEQKYKERKELTEKMTKLEKAWCLAFNDNNFDDLKKVMSEKC